MATDVEVLRFLWREAKDEPVSEVRFETADSVDDLVIVTGGSRFLVQAKRSLSFSTSQDSDFVSVTNQFVDQFVREPEANDVYVLATSLDASRTIRVDLQKLTEAARLNELGLTANPLTGPEEDLLEKTRALLSSRFVEQAGRAMTIEERDELFRRIHVAVLDIESGGNLESAIRTIIASQFAVDPEAIWASLIALALSLAKERLSIDRQGLGERLDRFLKPPPGVRGVSVPEAVMVKVASPVSAGREVVLAQDAENRLVLVELIRFTKDGSRRVRFADGQLVFPDGRRWRVLRRASTFLGMERLLASEPSRIEGRDVTIVPMKSDDDPEVSPWAEAHAFLCKQWLEGREPMLECIQCGRPISETSPLLVEVDEEGLENEVGLTHTACLRPAHRVLGRGSIEGPPLPPDFDHRAWIETRPTGQGAFNGMSPLLQGRIVTIGWEPGRLQLATGNWGVTYQLEDGSMRYVHKRGRVPRLTKSEAEEQTRFFNDMLATAEEANDPFCGSSTTGAFGTYSVLLRTEPRAQLLKVVSAEPRELTRATLIANDEVENFYAPLLGLVKVDTGRPFALNGAYVLLTDPLRFPDNIGNWQNAGQTVPELHTIVLRSDDQFDSFVVNAFRDSMGVVIDPLLDLSGKPVAGFLVQDIGQLASGST
ncbi:MAG: hypothetical protein M3P18_26245 [Actinomycetota bacterium]|nr:hypothetical protein [Actinomycetota bacterium]